MSILRVKGISFIACTVIVGLLVFFSASSNACGGFFCSLQPIVQAQEQIVFKQNGKQITTMVQIQYSGEAEDFAWVLPVPGVPDLAVGDTSIIRSLERSTRPRFSLISKGKVCDQDLDFNRGGSPEDASATPGSSSSSSSSSSGVIVVASKEVGPFDAQVVSSADPKAMTTWLVENNFDLSSRGEELITPYVEMGMNFLALKLKSGAKVGDIRPVILDYESEKPMIPIKLTAVAAEDDMGIIVWLLGSSRAVPENYPSVIPNYANLNWFSRNPFVVYSSYQNIVTAAMDEVGGQGFATDYAGKDIDVLQNMPDVVLQRTEFERFKRLNDKSFLSSVVSSSLFVVADLQSIYEEALPFVDEVTLDLSTFIALMSDPITYDSYDQEKLAAGRALIEKNIEERLIESIEDSRAIFAGDYYLTRLYTTLSAEDMTEDPVFTFNAEMPSQTTLREATETATCFRDNNKSTTFWSVTLGEGTQREGEVIFEGNGLPPSYMGVNFPSTGQSNYWQNASTAATGEPKIIKQQTFEKVLFKSNGESLAIADEISYPGNSDSPRSPRASAGKSSSGGALGWAWMILMGLMFGLKIRLNAKAS